MLSFVAENGNFKTSDSAALGGYEIAASGPIWLVQTGLGPQTVKVCMLMGQQAFGWRHVYVGRHVQPV
jgi:hypothetical protein